MALATWKLKVNQCTSPFLSEQMQNVFCQLFHQVQTLKDDSLKLSERHLEQQVSAPLPSAPWSLSPATSSPNFSCGACQTSSNNVTDNEETLQSFVQHILSRTLIKSQMQLK